MGLPALPGIDSQNQNGFGWKGPQRSPGSSACPVPARGDASCITKCVLCAFRMHEAAGTPRPPPLQQRGAMGWEFCSTCFAFSLHLPAPGTPKNLSEYEMLKNKQTNKLGNALKERLLNQDISALQSSLPAPQAQITKQ